MPAALILSSTAVIASVLAFCASCAVRARLSAAIVTHARSGARLTTPSPLVTMTAGAGGVTCCANDGAAVSNDRQIAITSLFIEHRDLPPEVGSCLTI